MLKRMNGNLAGKRDLAVREFGDYDGYYWTVRVMVM
jgi:hypothetical protein